MESNKKNQEHWIENIRAIAIIMVVFGHSIILYSSEWDLYSTIHEVIALDYIKRFINLIQMPLFFSLSGYCFRYTIKKETGIGGLAKKEVFQTDRPVSYYWFTMDDAYQNPAGLSGMEKSYNRQSSD